MNNIIFSELRKLFFGPKRREFLELRCIRHFRRFGQIAPCLPNIIQIQTHSACNGSCIYCPYPELKNKLKQGKMEWPLFEKLANDMARWEGLDKAALMLQNEPLLDKDFFNYIRYIKAKKPDLKIVTVTNGTLLDDSMVEQLSISGLDELTISVDAFSRATYEVLHPGFSYEKTIEGIQSLLKHKSEGLSVKLSFVSTKINYHELPDFIKFVKRNGAKWRALFFFNRADTVKEYNRIRLPKHKWHALKPRLMYKYFYRTCPFPFYQMNVLFNGDVIICCHDWQRNVVIDNIKAHSLQEIWTGEKFDGLRKKILQKKYESISSCFNCNIARLSL